MQQKFTPLFRLWHWLTAFSVLGLAGTVFLRMSFLNKNINAEIIRAKLESFHIALTPDQAVAVAKAIRAPMWEWHYILAIFLGIAIALRIVAMLRGDAQLPLLKVLRSENMMERFKNIIHLLICLTILVIALTGAFYYFHDALGISKESAHWAKELHESLFWPLMVLIALHIGGVIRYELATRECLVSKMIHGE